MAINQTQEVEFEVLYQIRWGTDSSQMHIPEYGIKLILLLTLIRDTTLRIEINIIQKNETYVFMRISLYLEAFLRYNRKKYCYVGGIFFLLFLTIKLPIAVSILRVRKYLR